MVKEIVFDFDGTIADSFDLSIDIFNEISDEYEFKKFSDKEIEKLRDFGFGEVLKEVNISLFKLPAIIKKVQKRQGETIDQVNVCEGMLETLEKIKNEGYVLGILTSNKKENVEKFLKKHKIKSIEYINSGKNLFGKDKAIKKLLRDRELGKEEIIYVGDELRDWDACKKVGVKMIGVTWGYNSKKGFKKTNVDYLIDQPEQILGIVGKKN